ncbi:MAG: hypothetical protein RXR36_05095 [Nitrososphaeria archaeon]|jgi:hypothetical protein
MKIVVTYDRYHRLKPLDEAELIGFYDDSKGIVEEVKNPGYMKSKEFTMFYILKMKPDAIAVKDGFLCPGSYAMSKGKLKYILTDKESVEQFIDNVKEANLMENLDEQVYSEDEF